jgi:hypothetical protein
MIYIYTANYVEDVLVTVTTVCLLSSNVKHTSNREFNGGKVQVLRHVLEVIRRAVVEELGS